MEEILAEKLVERKLAENKETDKLLRKASLIKSYVFTEKAIKLYETNQRQYSFIADPSLVKGELKFILEFMFDVEIKSIRTLNLFSKKKKVGKFVGKKTRAKKVYITLHKNQSINNLYN